MESLLLVKILCTGSVAAGTVGAGYVFKEQIGRVFKRSNTSASGGPGTAKKADVAKHFVYVVAKYTKSSPAVASETAPTAPPTYNFTIKLEGESNKPTLDKELSIYLLTAPEATSAGIDFSKTFVEKNKVKAELTTGTDYYVKLSKDAYDLIKESRTFSVIDKSDTNTALGSFSFLSGAISETVLGDKITIELSSSNLVVVKIASVETALNSFNTLSDLTCSIGSSEKSAPCTTYKFAADDEPLTQEKFVGLTKVTTPTTDIAVGKFILIDLKDQVQSLSDIEHQVVIFKKAGNELLAKGLVEQILIGSVDDSTSPSLKAYLVPSPLSSLKPFAGVDGVKSAYLLTKGGSLHTTLKTTNPDGTNYICRVVDATNKYEDPNCKLFSFDSTAATFSFDVARYSDSSDVIKQSADLGTGKHQIVKLSQTLADKLSKSVNGLMPSIEIIYKTSKDSAWNNRLVALTKVKELTSDPEKLDAIKTNSLLVRVKETGATVPTEASPIAEKTKFTCSISVDSGSPVAEPCNLYTFNNITKNTNKIPASEFASMTTGSQITAAFTKENYYVLELADSKKSLSEIKNREISLKLKDSPNTEVGKFVFDQLVFGQVGQAASLAKPKEAVFIVEKTTPEGATDVTLTQPYRCHFASTTSGATINFDDTCTLSKLPAPAAAETKIISLTEIKAPAAAVTGTWTLKTDQEHFYKLTFDSNKLYNVDLTPADGVTIKIEILPAGQSTATNFGSVKLVNNITGTTPTGKVDLIVGKVSATVPNVSSLTEGQCVFKDADTVKLNCSLYKDSTNNSNTEVNKATFAASAVATSSDVTAGKLVAIKFADAKNISDFEGKTIIYKPKADVSQNQIEFDIKGILGGSIDANKKHFILKSFT